jgi:hypothetical protein
VPFFKVQVGEDVYELDKLTLGDGRILKRDFGLTDLEEFNPGDPDVMVGLLSLAIKHSKGVSLADATAIAEAVDFEDFTSLGDEDEADPTPAAPAADDPVSEPKSAGTGNSAKPRKKTGKQS